MALQRRSARPADQRDRAFSEYYAVRGPSMRATAYLLCSDWHLAEDLVQTAFSKLYLAWHRVNDAAALDAYTRRTIVRAFLDHRRRPSRREVTAEVESGVFERSSLDRSVDDRVVLLKALAAVPPRQRAVLVLRFWEDLSVEDTAEVLGCSPGTVKSQSARGLQTLRELLGETISVEDVR